MGWGRSCCWLLFIYIYAGMLVYVFLLYTIQTSCQSCISVAIAYAAAAVLTTENAYITKSHRAVLQPTCVRDRACILTFRFYYDFYKWEKYWFYLEISKVFDMKLCDHVRTKWNKEAEIALQLGTKSMNNVKL